MKFYLSAVIGVSAYTVVEAETLAEAMEIAEERSGALDFNGSGADENESWIVSEVDGVPRDISEQSK